MTPVTIASREPFVEVRVLRSCWISGRRARRDDRRTVQRDEAAMLIAAGTAELLHADHRRAAA